jgi:hypothetical protein
VQVLALGPFDCLIGPVALEKKNVRLLPFTSQNILKNLIPEKNCKLNLSASHQNAAAIGNEIFRRMAHQSE